MHCVVRNFQLKLGFERCARSDRNSTLSKKPLVEDDRLFRSNVRALVKGRFFLTNQCDV